MEYSYREPPEKHNGQHWFGHEVSLFIKQTRREECWAYLDKIAGPKGQAWRLNSKHAARMRDEEYFRTALAHPHKITIRFAEKNRAVMFKLTWDEDVDPEIEWKEQLNQVWGKMNLNSLYGKLGQRSQAAALATQSLGRGLRNVNITSVRPSGPAITPISNASSGVMPWYDAFTAGMISRKTVLNKMGLSDIDSIFMDTEAGYDPTWLARMTEPKPNPRKYEILKGRATTMTTEQLQLRIDHGIQQQETTVPETTEALQERILAPDEGQQATRARDIPPRV